jgi:hypothetical protein
LCHSSHPGCSLDLLRVILGLLPGRATLRPCRIQQYCRFVTVSRSLGLSLSVYRYSHRRQVLSCYPNDVWGREPSGPVAATPIILESPGTDIIVPPLANSARARIIAFTPYAASQHAEGKQTLRLAAANRSFPDVWYTAVVRSLEERAMRMVGLHHLICTRWHRDPSMATSGHCTRNG